MAPPFESLPPEIRCIIYTHLLPLLGMTLKAGDWGAVGCVRGVGAIS